MSQDPLDRLEDVLNYSFRDRSLLTHALTHSSRKNEVQYSNERLEFLGDAILGAVVSDYLYRHFPDFTEGHLTRVKSRVVSRATLGHVGQHLGLGQYLLVAKGVARAPLPEAPKPASRRHRGLPPSLVSDALEAVVAAIYLDGGMEPARNFVLRELRNAIDKACKTAHVHNYKSALQQVLAEMKLFVLEKCTKPAR